MCEMDIDDGDTMNKKIRNAQLAQYNFIFGESINTVASFQMSYDASRHHSDMVFDIIFVLLFCDMST